MKHYIILHPSDGSLNTLGDKMDFSAVCVVEADNLEGAFKLSQNDFSEEYKKRGKRSTSVGDLLHCIEENVTYEAEDIGFKVVGGTMEITSIIKF